MTAVQKPLRRGHEFFFGRCIHDVPVACQSTGCCVYVKSESWASQKKSVKYTGPKVIFVEAKEDEPVQVLHEGCSTGQDLC